MRVLLFVLGLLALLSGALKLRGRIRTRIGTSPLALAELAVGALAVWAGVVGASGAGAVVPTLAALVTIVAAAVHQTRLTAAFTRRRAEAEELRLRAYLHSQGEAVPGGPGQDDGDLEGPGDAPPSEPDPP